MNTSPQNQSKSPAAKGTLAPPKPAALQRKCACGALSVSGECEECKTKKLDAQLYSADRVPPSTLVSSLAGSSDEKHAPSIPEADSGHNFGRIRIHAATPTPVPVSTAAQPPVMIQRLPADLANDAVEMPAPSPAPTTEPVPATQEPVTREAAPAALLVDDDAEQLAPGQMRKSEFIDELQRTICAEADAELARLGRSTEGCPYIEKWMGHYRARSSSHAERSLRRFAPEAAGATSARDYIPFVAARVRRSVAVWAATGRMTGVPEELAGQLPGAGLLGGMLGAASGLLGGVGRMLGGLFTKGREGTTDPRRDTKEHEEQADDPERIRGALGSGRSLDAGVKSRMESAFGHDFSRVRIHADGKAGQLSDNLNARAFTVGPDIAFASGEYQPNTPVGDALLAHELAHVVQQSGEVAFSGRPQDNAAQYAALEDAADESAIGAVVSLWGSEAGLQGRRSMPGLRSGLRLQRCSPKAPAKTTTPTKEGEKAEACPTDEAVTKLKVEVKTAFGFSQVTEEGACWTAKELTKTKGALEKIPADQLTAIKGVTLKRVKVSSCTGGDPSGCFIGKVNEKTKVREDVIEIADKAFEEDKQIEDPSVATVKEYDLAGKLKTTLPSQRTVLHEVGHAVESAEKRPKELERFKLDVAAAEKKTALGETVKEFNRTAVSVPPITWSNGKEKAYVEAIEDAARKLDAILKPINKLGKKPTHSALKTAATDADDAITKASKAIGARNKARKALPAGSSVIQSTLEKSQDDNLAAARKMLTAVEALRDAQKELEGAEASEEAASAEIKAGAAEKKMPRRLAELVALIALKKIDIKASKLSSYVKDKWPDDPGEVFADLYQMSVTEKEGLKVFDPDVAKFFDTPIGPKGKWKAQVDAWIKTH